MIFRLIFGPVTGENGIIELYSKVEINDPDKVCFPAPKGAKSPHNKKGVWHCQPHLVLKDFHGAGGGNRTPKGTRPGGF